MSVRKIKKLPQLMYKTEKQYEEEKKKFIEKEKDFKDPEASWNRIHPNGYETWKNFGNLSWTGVILVFDKINKLIEEVELLKEKAK